MKLFQLMRYYKQFNVYESSEIDITEMLESFEDFTNGELATGFSTL